MYDDEIRAKLRSHCYAAAIEQGSDAAFAMKAANAMIGIGVPREVRRRVKAEQKSLFKQLRKADLSEEAFAVLGATFARAAIEGRARGHAIALAPLARTNGGV